MSSADQVIRVYFYDATFRSVKVGATQPSIEVCQDLGKKLNVKDVEKFHLYELRSGTQQGRQLANEEQPLAVKSKWPADGTFKFVFKDESSPFPTEFDTNNKPTSVYKSGYLTKRGRINTAWKKRWFVLKDNFLYYYQKDTEESGGEPLGALPLQDCYVGSDEAEGGKQKYVFKVVTRDSDRDYIIATENSDDRNFWIDAIKQARTNAGGAGPSMPRSSMSHLGPAEKMGFLTKRGHIVRNWKKRWFVLTDNRLYYFRSRQDDTHAGVVNLKSCSVHIIDNHPRKKFCFEIITPIGIPFIMSASNKQEMDEWIRSIKKVIDELENRKNTKMEPPKQNDMQFLNKLLEMDKEGNTAEKEKSRVSLADFDLLKVLGKGSFGKVMLAQKKDDKKIYAIKILKKEVIIERNEIEHLMTEKNVLSLVKHPFLVHLLYAFQTDENLYFVMNYVNGGEMFYHLRREKRFAEDRARFYAAEIILALEYLHHLGIVYRDLKLENILLDMHGHIALTDFGLAKQGMEYGQTTRTFCGTPEYLAPEVLEDNQYGRQVDWWCLGIVIFEFLTGHVPFYSSDPNKLFLSILRDDVYYPSFMSPTAKSLITGLLTRDPNRRLGGGADDSKSIKQHPFFATIDWAKLEKKEVTTPWKPNVASETDVSNFDPEFTSETPIITPTDYTLSDGKDTAFEGFTYTPQSAVANAQQNRTFDDDFDDDF